MDARTLAELVFLVGEDRIIFGLDFPYKSLADTRAAIEIIQGLQISDRAKEQILGGTLRALLAPARA
jgi:predicted TIM-barrel fold metal-dependent hydrolase